MLKQMKRHAEGKKKLPSNVGAYGGEGHLADMMLEPFIDDENIDDDPK
ncbi:hypothetical protein K0T92_04095 [Paenibacillus oenotherae]|uniref:Uncharacterized protein n=1 Tax=Paenibacillus oenotherae TaxID=1435645 RepID=A0ABS7D1X0_9BACL|nr:hypothetical protein [Paenibacillus oenotherae]MBW7473913.1 hypothetical protein [Paenibacillus oenotherae]